MKKTIKRITKKQFDLVHKQVYGAYLEARRANPSLSLEGAMAEVVSKLCKKQ